MTITEKAVCEVYTGIAFCIGEERRAVYQYAEMLLGRPVQECEFGSEYILQRLKELSKMDFIKICRGISLDFVLDMESEEV